MSSCRSGSARQRIGIQGRAVEKKACRMSAAGMVAELGLEPRLSESESLVLPITPFGMNECENLAINPDVIKKDS